MKSLTISFHASLTGRKWLLLRFFLLLIITASIGCRAKISSQTDHSSAQTFKTTEFPDSGDSDSASLDSVHQSTSDLPDTIGPDTIEFVSVGDIKLEDGRKNEGWKHAEVIEASMPFMPDTAEQVTLVPLTNDLPSINLSVRGAQRTLGCGKEIYRLEFSPIHHPSYLNAEAPPKKREEYPFDVGIVYPALQPAGLAESVPVGDLSAHQLPGTFALETVKAAIRIDGQNHLSALVFRFCCDSDGQISPAKANSSGLSCMTCSATYLWSRNHWEVVDSGSPC